MTLEENEYTIQTFIEYMNKNFKKKTGERFNISDIFQYLLRGYLPYRYGGKLITDRKESGIKIITIHENKIK